MRVPDQVPQLAARKGADVFACRLQDALDGFAAVEGDVWRNDDAIPV